MRYRFVPLLVVVGLKAKEKQAILRTRTRGEESYGGVRVIRTHLSVIREAAVSALEKPIHPELLSALGQERELGQDTWESTWLMRTG